LGAEDRWEACVREGGAQCVSLAAAVFVVL
jgi:hypothetical protein